MSTKFNSSPPVSVACPESKSGKANLDSEKLSLSKEPTDSNKSPVGIAEFDDVVNGGFPIRSFILISGNAGSGKTIFSTQFLYNGAVKYNEKGLYVSFGENRDDYYRSMLSLGMDMRSLEKKGLFKFMDLVTMNGKNALEVIMEQILETISEMKAKRLVIDPLSVLLQSLSPVEVRTFLHTILSKVTKSLDVTTIAIAEIPYGETTTGLGLEEFVADGVILMTHMGKEGSESRKLTIAKLRGTPLDRASFEYVIDKKHCGVGLVVLPKRILMPFASQEKLSTGVTGLDTMMYGGVFKGSVTLIEGATGIGKTTFCLHFLADNAQKGMKALYISYEEPVGQIKRAMKNLGLDQLALGDNLIIDSYVPESLTPLHYYTLLSDMLDLHKPAFVALDSITAMQQLLSKQDFILFVRYLQLICKQRGLTVFLTSANNDLTKSSDISVLADNIIILRYFEVKDTTGREISVLKTRGSQHTKKTASFEITGKGIIVQN